MEPWALAVFAKPFAAFGLFFVAAYIARAVMRRLPNGKLKRILGFTWRV